MPEDEFASVPIKFIEDLSQRIEKLQQSLKRKQCILTKVLLIYIINLFDCILIFYL